VERIEKAILFVRWQKVMLDRDLAAAFRQLAFGGCSRTRERRFANCIRYVELNMTFGRFHRRE